MLATAYDVVAIDGSNFSICPQKLEFRFIRLGVLHSAEKLLRTYPKMILLYTIIQQAKQTSAR
jgi:hypothetical protein